MSSTNDQVIIKVENVSKKFAKSLKRSMIYGLKDISRNLFKLPTKSNNLRKDEFWAVNDVSFEVKKGECLGIIGANGSGKTTLLSLLNGIYMPDTGKIMTKGKVGALIAVGAGFHPMLTGRENIYINGAVLGLRKDEIDENFDEIVEFADIGDFIDSPVKFYSSGMYIRLGFSIAINIAPDILIIDEILSVGDLSFQNKSLRKLNKLREEASAVVFVTHNLEHMRSICDKVLVLDEGAKIYYGDIDRGIVTYQEMLKNKNLRKLKRFQEIDHKGLIHKSSGEIDFGDHGLMDKFGNKIDSANFGDDFTLFFEFEIKEYIKELIFNVAISNQNNIKCMADWSNDERNKIEKKYNFTNLSKGKYRLIVNYKNPRLTPDTYSPSLAIRNPITGETYEKIKIMDPFVIIGDIIHRGIVKADPSWKLEYI